MSEEVNRELPARKTSTNVTTVQLLGQLKMRVWKTWHQNDQIAGLENAGLEMNDAARIRIP